MAASARANHLDTASKALLASSPAVSAYLQIQRNGTTTTDNNTSTLQPCLSCGTLLIAGWNASRVRATKRTRRDRIAGIHSTRCKIKCSPCGTIQDMRVKITKSNATISKSASRSTASSKPQKTPSASLRQTTPISPARGADEPAAPLSTAPAEEPNQASSKKRSRNKKSTNNLQAMLANRKAPTNPRNTGFGLGLGDFIK